LVKNLIIQPSLQARCFLAGVAMPTTFRFAMSLMLFGMSRSKKPLLGMTPGIYELIHNYEHRKKEKI
jgi:hypothetical protein